jgi:cytochrome b involved in lipid metabolism
MHKNKWCLPANVLIIALLAFVCGGCNLDPGPGKTGNQTADSNHAAAVSQTVAAPETQTVSQAEAESAADTDLPTGNLVYPKVLPADKGSSSKNVNVFLSGTMSMMGFVNLKDDATFRTRESVYVESVSNLIDVLIRDSYNAKFYRYDEYRENGKSPDLSLMQIPDSETVRSDIASLSFYVPTAYDLSDTIPEGFNRSPEDDTSKLGKIPGYFDGNAAYTALENSLKKTEYPLANALDNFDKNKLNIVVTDLNGLRNGEFDELKTLDNYSVGVLAVSGEFNGYLTGAAGDGFNLIWGSPPIGSYKTAEYESGHLVFEPFTDNDIKPTQKMRNFYIIAAGKPDDVSTFLDELTGEINSSVSGFRKAELDYKNLYFTNVADKDSASVTFDGNDENLASKISPDGAVDISAAYEIRQPGKRDASSDKVNLVMHLSANYAQDEVTSGKSLTPGDFAVTSVWYKQQKTKKSTSWQPVGTNGASAGSSGGAAANGGAAGSSGAAGGADGAGSASGGAAANGGANPTLTCSGSGDVKLSLDYNDLLSLDPGTYVVETHVVLNRPVASTDANADFTKVWGYNIDANTQNTLYNDISKYNTFVDNPNHGPIPTDLLTKYDAACEVFSRTLDLDRVTRYVKPDDSLPASQEVYAARVYLIIDE